MIYIPLNGLNQLDRFKERESVNYAFKMLYNFIRNKLFQTIYAL